MRQLLLATIAALACAGYHVAIHAQAPADATVYAVAYVDVMPSGKPAAVTALKAYRDASSREGGHIRIDLFDQVGRPGHFVVVEAWRDQRAFDAHAGSVATRQFQQAMTPLRVSGYDQRPYKALSIGTARASAGSAVHIVSHVDFAGAGAQAAAPGMLHQHAEASRKEQGNVRFDVLQHAMRANHFTVVESWASQAALDAHAAASHTRQYRDTLQPITGSPLDERVYLAVD
jgi:quinol monooxygenase YgiN